MADLKGRSKDMKDKVVGKGKEAYGKATDDKSKETEGKAQSLGSDIKEKLVIWAMKSKTNSLEKMKTNKQRSLLNESSK